MKGTRADVRLVELGLCQSREKARSLIMSGAVYINEVRIDKAGDAVPEDCVLTVRENPNPFVSRGGRYKIRYRPKRPCSDGRRRIHRRIYGLHASAWG